MGHNYSQNTNPHLSLRYLSNHQRGPYLLATAQQQSVSLEEYRDPNITILFKMFVFHYGDIGTIVIGVPDTAKSST